MALTAELDKARRRYLESSRELLKITKEVPSGNTQPGRFNAHSTPGIRCVYPSLQSRCFGISSVIQAFRIKYSNSLNSYGLRT